MGRVALDAHGALPPFLNLVIITRLLTSWRWFHLFQSQPVAIARRRCRGQTWQMTTKSREYLFGSTVKAKAEQAATARKKADRLACEAWNARMLGFRGPAPPSPAIGDALNGG